ncbi:MAG: FAD-dependent oxidoreductase [Sedimentisphaerales bacterium]|nr:FAD-dependent oxidoreductase [Sedimentisphaerales bacterium]
MRKRNQSFIIGLTFLSVAGMVSGISVFESPRELPVTHDVDVVVVGGTSAGVSAAIAAAQQEAKVLLITSRPYLGEDLCGTYRLWLEPGETPTTELGKALFSQSFTARLLGQGVPFTYKASLPSASKHPDTKIPSLLTDGKFGDAPSQSIQYDGPVSITAALARKEMITNVHVLVYQRTDDFEVESVSILTSEDKQSWQRSTIIENKKLNSGSFESLPIALTASINQTTKFIRFDIEKTPEVERILLAEIIIETKKNEERSKQAEPIPVMVTPMQIKRTFDQALLDAGVEFLFGCYATEVLHDKQGNPAGVVMTNKSGRQSVKAKVIIDATWRASLARIAGVQFSDYPLGEHRFKRVVVGGQVVQRLGLASRTILTSMQDAGNPTRNYIATEYTLTLPMPDRSPRAFAHAEQVARDMTWTRGQVDASETLFQIPPDPMFAQKAYFDTWSGADKINLTAFRPADVNRFYIAGPCADISRKVAEQLARPLNMLTIGTRIGTAAARQAKEVPNPQEIRLRSVVQQKESKIDTAETLTYVNLRGAPLTTIPADAGSISVLGEYDVVVVGGGTGGAPAAISAARQGAKTLLVEYLHGLGGVGTMGLISSYYHGNRVGFTSEIDAGVAAYGEHPDNRPGRWNVEWKMEWYRSELCKAGADIWLGSLGAGAVMEGNRVKGVVIATDHGRGAILAKVVIDATGNAAIAAAAGAQCTHISSENVAVQGTGLPPRSLGAGYTNTDYTFVDDIDIIDIWRVFVMSRAKYESAYDLGQLIDTRERRRIMGDITIGPLDIWNKRTYPDTIVIARSNFDSHGYTIHPVFAIRPPDREDIDVDVPYRALLPKGLDGIIVTGLAVSAHRDAMPVIRMQPDIQNQGYAMGVAAAMLAESGASTRNLDIKALQRHLIEKGNLSPRVLTDTDSFPIPDARIAEAVRQVGNNYNNIQTVLVDPDRSMPLLRRAYTQTKNPEEKVIYAHILGMLGNDTGTDSLVKAVNEAEWDKGWRFTGMGQFGMSLSKVDSLIIALGRTGSPKALGPIMDKIKELDASSEFSHHRAVAIATESMRDKRAAKALSDLLAKPKMSGYAYLDINQAIAKQPSSSTDNTTRERSLSELVLARALYRCGDYNGKGEAILKQYTKDLRGYYARHAAAVLTESQ